MRSLSLSAFFLGPPRSAPRQPQLTFLRMRPQPLSTSSMPKVHFFILPWTSFVVCVFFFGGLVVVVGVCGFFFVGLVVVVCLVVFFFGLCAMASEDSVSVFFNIVEKPQDIESLMAEQAESQQADVPYFPQSALLIGEELAEVIRDMSEEQVLAKFLDHEGGDLFERTLVAEIVCDLKKTWELDSIHEVFTTRRYFAISRDFWNSIENPSESSQQIAHMVLQSANSQEQYLSEYEAYYYAIDMEQIPEIMQQLIGEKEHFITTNYIFVRR